MKTAKEIFSEKTEGKLISDLESVMVECMEEYAQQFKSEKKYQLKTRWKDLNFIKGYYVSSASIISFWDKEKDEELADTDRNVFATREQAEAALALAQLSQLRKVYRQGWKPDWNDKEQEKYAIYFMLGEIEKDKVYSLVYFLTFQSAEIRDQFLENFRDLIEKAKPLMS